MYRDGKIFHLRKFQNKFFKGARFFRDSLENTFRKAFLGKPKVRGGLSLLFYMIQDTDLLIPIAAAAKKIGLDVHCLVTRNLQKNSPRVIEHIKKSNLEFSVFDLRKDKGVEELHEILSKCSAFMTAVESTAGPHIVGHKATLFSKELGLNTYTMQHGLENIGLTYFDSIYNHEDISFASDKIFLWSPEQLLHPQISADTKRKIVPIGCPKLFSSDGPKNLFPNRNPVVSIFENLHWERYSSNYISEFEACLLSAVESFPNINFVLKPHHAGRWASTKSEIRDRRLKNFILADPTQTQFEKFTGPSYISISDAVITTPSTISLDSAMMNKPVAVVKGDLVTSFYEPLPQLTSWKEWSAYLSSVEAGKLNIKKNDEFINKMLVTRTNAAIDICKHIFRDSKGRVSWKK